MVQLINSIVLSALPDAQPDETPVVLLFAIKQFVALISPSQQVKSAPLSFSLEVLLIIEFFICGLLPFRITHKPPPPADPYSPPPTLSSIIKLYKIGLA